MAWTLLGVLATLGAPAPGWVARMPCGICSRPPCPQIAEQKQWELPRFLRIEKVGSGMASSVYLAVDACTRAKVALKVYDKRQLTEPLLRGVMSEISIHGRMGAVPPRMRSAGCALRMLVVSHALVAASSQCTRTCWPCTRRSRTGIISRSCWITRARVTSTAAFRASEGRSMQWPSTSSPRF